MAGPYSRLRQELKQCQEDIQNFPFPAATPGEGQEKRQMLFPLFLQWEIPLGGGAIGYVNAPLRTEVRNFKRKLQPLLEDPQGVTDKVDQFLGPHFCTWSKLMSILSNLFSGKERGMTQRAAMALWEPTLPP